MIYVIWKGNILEMASNDKISITDLSDITQHKMEVGADVGDNVVLKNKVLRFSGLVSNIRSFYISRSSSSTNQGTSGNIKRDQKLVSEYFQLLKDIRDSREVVAVAFDPQIDGGGLQDCLIKEVSYRREPKLGDAYMVDMTVEQIRRTSAATFNQRREQSNPELNGEENVGGRKTTQEGELPPSDSIVNGGIKAIDGLFGGGG